jgi:hypothetical protein
MGPEDPLKTPTNTTRALSATPQEEESAAQLRLLRSIFIGGKPPADLPKGCFMLDKDDVDEDTAEETTDTILNHYQTISNLLEAGIGTKHTALSNEAWLRLNNSILAHMINGISRSYKASANESLISIILPKEQGILSNLRENAKTVATALAKFPFHEHQCDTCLRRVDNPIMTPDEYTALLHATDRSKDAVSEHVWEKVMEQVNKHMNDQVVKETTARKALVDAQARLDADQYRVQREAEIRIITEKKLNSFTTDYYENRRKAMVDMIDITIKAEEESLLHQRRAQLLPLAASITSSDLGAAHKALDEGLVSSANPESPQSTPLPGEDRLDSIIARLSDSFLNKLNDVAAATSNSSSKIDKLAEALDLRLSRLEGKTPATDAKAASGGGFMTARQAALIHSCAIDNFADHNLSQDNNRHTEQGLTQEQQQWLHEQEEELEYADPPTRIDVDLDFDLMTPNEILDEISEIPIPEEYLLPIPHIGSKVGPSAALTNTGPARVAPAQPQAQQPTSAVTLRPTTNLTANQAPPRPNYATAAASSGWKQVQTRKSKGKNKQNSQATTQSTPANNPPPKPPKNARPAPRPETLRTEITVQRPPGSVVTSLGDASLICRRVLAALRSARSLVPLLSGRWATHTHNYVYTFAGDIPFARITQVAHILLQPFPGGILAPCSGWSRVIFHGTPVSDPDSDAMYTKEQLMDELARNPICSKLQFILPPSWVRHPDNIASATSSISFAFVDRDGEITKTMKKAHLAMFGKPVTFARWVSRPPLSQCGRCHKLGHIANRCSMPRDSIRCYKCGKGHSAQDHNVSCPRAKSHRVHGTCDCEPLCLNCNEKGHYAIDVICKARNAFRIPARDSIDDDITV